MNWLAAWRALHGKPQTTETVHLPSPIDVGTVYKKRYGDTFYTTPAAAFAHGYGSDAVQRYSAFKAGGRWYGFRGHFVVIEVSDGPGPTP